MFSNLIESGSHAADLRRKGRFFLGTIVFYGLLLVATGVGSIYAYNVRLDEPNDLEVLALLHFPPADAPAEQVRREPARPASGQARESQPATRIELSVQNPNLQRVASEKARDIDPHTPFVFDDVDHDQVAVGGPAGPYTTGGTTDSNSRGVGPVVADTVEPPPARTAPTPAPRPDKPVALSSVVISSKAISKPAPPYPPA